MYGYVDIIQDVGSVVVPGLQRRVHHNPGRNPIDVYLLVSVGRGHFISKFLIPESNIGST
jgi:hypothetical protein